MDFTINKIHIMLINLTKVSYSQRGFQANADTALEMSFDGLDYFVRVGDIYQHLNENKQFKPFSFGGKWNNDGLGRWSCHACPSRDLGIFTKNNKTIQIYRFKDLFKRKYIPLLTIDVANQQNRSMFYIRDDFYFLYHNSTLLFVDKHLNKLFLIHHNGKMDTWEIPRKFNVINGEVTPSGYLLKVKLKGTKVFQKLLIQNNNKNMALLETLSEPEVSNKQKAITSRMKNSVVVERVFICNYKDIEVFNICIERFQRRMLEFSFFGTKRELRMLIRKIKEYSESCTGCFYNVPYEGDKLLELLKEYLVGKHYANGWWYKIEFPN